MGYTETRIGTVAPMEIFRAPRVSLIARPQFIEPEHLPVHWLGEASDGERLAEYAGRLCYMSQRNPVNRTTAEYLENIKKQGHGSVLAHAWRTMLELRCGEGAELEIRRMAIAVLRVLQREAGALFSDFEIYVGDDKQEAARVAYHKV